MIKPLSNKIILETDFDGFNYSAMYKPMRKRLFRYLPALRWGVFAVGLIAFIVAEQLKQRGFTNTYSPLALLLPLALVFFIVGGFFRSRRTWEAVSSAPFRTGPIKIEMDAKGFRKTRPGFSLTIDWSLVLDVIDGNDGLLLLVSDFEAEPLPLRAFPESMTQDSLKSQIQLWIDEAKVRLPD